MKLSDYLDNIQKKYNYDNETMKAVYKAFLGLVYYYSVYGNYFNKIYHLFMNTEIIPYDIHLDYYEEKDNLIRMYSNQNEHEIKYEHTMGEGGELLTKVVNDNVIKTVIVKKDNGKIKLDNLVHEMIHGLTTSDKVISEDDKKYILTGVSKSFIEPCEYTNNHSIEEGFTEYDTVGVCALLDCAIEPTEGYLTHYKYVKTIMDDPFINNVINKSRLDGINYIEKLKDEDYKYTLHNYIVNFESVIRNKDRKEKEELLELNKQNVQKILRKERF